MLYAPKSSIIRNYCYMVTFDIIVFFKTFLKKKSALFGRPFSIMGENYVMKLYGLIITAQVKDYFNPKLRFS